MADLGKNGMAKNMDMLHPRVALILCNVNEVTQILELRNSAVNNLKGIFDSLGRIFDV